MAIVYGFQSFQTQEPVTSGAPPYGVSEEEVPDDPYAQYKNWSRPDGPPKVGLQVGHWKNNELPDELERLRGNSGATGGGKNEWEVNFAIAEIVKFNLEEKGVKVDILPSTVPSQYLADVFLAIHADGSTEKSKRGFKVAAPWRDLTGKANTLVNFLTNSYREETGYTIDPNITRNMRGYYAFSWWRYEHAIHPMTTAAIFETGFLTNVSDQKLLVHNPSIPARGISDGIISYLDSQHLLQ